MKTLFLSGKFISEIARETGRDWKTVAKIVRSADMVRYMQECRGKAMELIPDILHMVHTEMRKSPNKDRVRAGMDYLTRTGIFEVNDPHSREVSRGVRIEEQETLMAKKVIEGLGEMAIHTHRLFGLDMPELGLTRNDLANDPKRCIARMKSELASKCFSERGPLASKTKTSPGTPN